MGELRKCGSRPFVFPQTPQTPKSTKNRHFRAKNHRNWSKHLKNHGFSSFFGCFCLKRPHAAILGRRGTIAIANPIPMPIGIFPLWRRDALVGRFPARGRTGSKERFGSPRGFALPVNPVTILFWGVFEQKSLVFHYFWRFWGSKGLMRQPSGHSGPSIFKSDSTFASTRLHLYLCVRLSYFPGQAVWP